MKYPQVVSMPSAVSNWLEEQLEARGIDSEVYTRYILSLLHAHTLDLIYPDDEFVFAPIKKEGGKGNTKRVHRTDYWWRHVHEDPERIKRSAAVECLISAADQNCEIESLVDELCEKLKIVDSEADSAPLKTSQIPEDCKKISKPKKISSKELAEKYYAAFPPLNQKEGNSYITSNINLVVGKWPVIEKKLDKIDFFTTKWTSVSQRKAKKKCSKMSPPLNNPSDKGEEKKDERKPEGNQAEAEHLSEDDSEFEPEDDPDMYMTFLHNEMPIRIKVRGPGAIKNVDKWMARQLNNRRRCVVLGDPPRSAFARYVAPIARPNPIGQPLHVDVEPPQPYSLRFGPRIQGPPLPLHVRPKPEATTPPPETADGYDCPDHYFAPINEERDGRRSSTPYPDGTTFDIDGDWKLPHFRKNSQGQLLLQTVDGTKLYQRVCARQDHPDVIPQANNPGEGLRLYQRRPNPPEAAASRVQQPSYKLWGGPYVPWADTLKKVQKEAVSSATKSAAKDGACDHRFCIKFEVKQNDVACQTEDISPDSTPDSTVVDEPQSENPSHGICEGIREILIRYPASEEELAEWMACETDNPPFSDMVGSSMKTMKIDQKSYCN